MSICSNFDSINFVHRHVHFFTTDPHITINNTYAKPDTPKYDDGVIRTNQGRRPLFGHFLPASLSLPSLLILTEFWASFPSALPRFSKLDVGPILHRFFAHTEPVVIFGCNSHRRWRRLRFADGSEVRGWPNSRSSPTSIVAPTKRLNTSKSTVDKKFFSDLWERGMVLKILDVKDAMNCIKIHSISLIIKWMLEHFMMNLKMEFWYHWLKTQNKKWF